MGIFDEYWDRLTSPNKGDAFVRAQDPLSMSIARGIRDTVDFPLGRGSMGENVLNTILPGTPGTSIANWITNPQSNPAPQTVTREDVAPQVTSNDVSADLRLKNRVQQQSGIASAGFSPVMAQLEQQRSAYLAQRDAAIRAAGRGAGAGYNAAIARLDDEIAKLQAQMPGVTGLFAQKIQNQYDIYDRAGKELETSYDPAMQELEVINKIQNDNLRGYFSEAQSGVEDFLARIGADENTSVAVAQEVGQLQDSIIEMDAVSAEGTRNIMQAAERLAVASAIATGATNALDLKRKQIEVESDMKERLQEMIADREQQIQARNAAVSAARELEAARWPEDQPFNRSGFQVTSVTKYLREQGVEDEGIQLAGELISQGMTATDLRKVLANTRNHVPNQTAKDIMAGFGIDAEKWFGYLPNTRQPLGTIANAMDIYSNSGMDYDARYKNNPDPLKEPLNSAARAMAGQQLLLNNGWGSQDSFHQGRAIAETPNEELGWLKGIK